MISRALIGQVPVLFPRRVEFSAGTAPLSGFKTDNCKKSKGDQSLRLGMVSR
jgi:hypothetical protein